MSSPPINSRFLSRFEGEQEEYLAEGAQEILQWDFETRKNTAQRALGNLFSAKDYHPGQNMAVLSYSMIRKMASLTDPAGVCPQPLERRFDLPAGTERKVAEAQWGYQARTGI